MPSANWTWVRHGYTGLGSGTAIRDLGQGTWVSSGKAIRGRRGDREAIRATQGDREAIRGTQGDGEAIRG